MRDEEYAYTLKQSLLGWVIGKPFKAASKGHIEVNNCDGTSERIYFLLECHPDFFEPIKKDSLENNKMKKLIGYRLKKDIPGSPKGTIFMPGNDWIEAVFEGDEYWDNRSDEEILAEWMKKKKWEIYCNKRVDYSCASERKNEFEFARTIIETFNLDVSKIKNKV